jgi:hypothetical protein
MNTIFITNDLALTPQPRSATSFPSGLVRVDQRYIGLTEKQATHRGTLAIGNFLPDGDKHPAIDWEDGSGFNFEPSLKIFPEAQETRRDDGFTEYTVAAYGRINLGTTRRGFSIEKFSKNFSMAGAGDAPANQWTITEFWELETITEFKTFKSTETIEDLVSPALNLLKRLRSRQIAGNPPQGGVFPLNLSWQVSILSINRTNYGHIDEVITTWGYTAEP